MTETEKSSEVCVRRVGSFTMGLSLIGTGIVSIMALINPEMDIFRITKYAPVVLILLGIEILAANLRKDQATIKYDFLSMAMCFVLIFTVLCLTGGMMVFQYYVKCRL